MSESTEWIKKAKCTGLDVEKFLPSEKETKKERYAKRICKGCPVRRPCLEYAIATDSIGVFSGTNYSERQLMVIMMPSLLPATSVESSHNDKTFQWERQPSQIEPDIGYIPTLRGYLPWPESPL